eukprot:TRINITY_DN2510_c0_g1_i7.p1 TRINITY_DN2510_c0_g1~~TRINITY_DN2510_c0_g1_i7.p1  ORF type:complete len:206 (-),score=20.48 TRINITY_DN2510_c0_g1_i7:300-917(-)
MNTILTDSTSSSMKIFTCQHPGCTKAFSSKFSLKRHQGIHCNTKSFTCNYCGKKFAIAQYLKEHSYCHTKEKFYVCGIDGCQKAFRHASDISLHRRSHPEFKVRRYRYLQSNNPAFAKDDSNSRLKVVHVEMNEDYVRVKDLKNTNATDFHLVSFAKNSTKNVLSPELKEDEISKRSLNTEYIKYLISISEGKITLERPQLPLPK